MSISDREGHKGRRILDLFKTHLMSWLTLISRNTKTYTKWISILSKELSILRGNTMRSIQIASDSGWTKKVILHLMWCIHTKRIFLRLWKRLELILETKCLTSSMQEAQSLVAISLKDLVKSCSKGCKHSVKIKSYKKNTMEKFLKSLSNSKMINFIITTSIKLSKISLKNSTLTTLTRYMISQSKHKASTKEECLSKSRKWCGKPESFKTLVKSFLEQLSKFKTCLTSSLISLKTGMNPSEIWNTQIYKKVSSGTSKRQSRK